ncbi:MAG: hypothetical protein SGARI_002293 [Bacillariaceae sp.]
MVPLDTVATGDRDRPTGIPGLTGPNGGMTRSYEESSDADDDNCLRLSFMMTSSRTLQYKIVKLFTGVVFKSTGAAPGERGEYRGSFCVLKDYWTVAILTGQMADDGTSCDALRFVTKYESSKIKPCLEILQGPHPSKLLGNILSVQANGDGDQLYVLKDDSAWIFGYKGKGRFVNPQRVRVGGDGIRAYRKTGIDLDTGLLVCHNAQGRFYHFRGGKVEVWSDFIDKGTSVVDDDTGYDNVDTHESSLHTRVEPKKGIELVPNAPIAAMCITVKGGKMKAYAFRKNTDTKAKHEFPIELVEVSGSNAHFNVLAFHRARYAVCVRSDRGEAGKAFFYKVDQEHKGRKRGESKEDIPKGDYLKDLCASGNDERLSNPIQAELFMMKSKLDDAYADLFAGVLTENGFAFLQMKHSTGRYPRPACNFKPVPESFAGVRALASNDFCLVALSLPDHATTSGDVQQSVEDSSQTR